jgi:SAM-dependent methyltransferase
MDELAQNTTNRRTWSTPAARRDLDGVHGYTDPGEQAAIERVREEVRGKPILDLGVGTGRTIRILSPLGSASRALDIQPQMVALCRARHPGARVDVGDAREHSDCPSNHFGLVYFSFNGIDAVSSQDRRRVLRAVRRVLAPRGIFLFSTLNLDGPSFRERPWRVRLWRSRNPIRHAVNIGRWLMGVPLDIANWMRIRREGERGPGYAVAPLSAHHYGVLAHYTTLSRQLEELAQEGFSPEVPVFESCHGDRVSPEDDTSKIDWFTILARRKDGE